MISPISYNLSSKNLSFKNNVKKAQKTASPQNDPLKNAKDIFLSYFPINKKTFVQTEPELDESLKERLKSSMDLIHTRPAKNNTYSIAQRNIDSDEALEYIFKKGNRPKRPTTSAAIVKELLEAVALNVADKDRREDIVNNILFVWRDDCGQTLFESFKNESKRLNDLFRTALISSRDLPGLQLKILGTKTDKGKYIATCIKPQDCDWQTKEEINETLYDLCIENKIADAATRNKLYRAYESFLNDDNLQILRRFVKQ